MLNRLFCQEDATREDASRILLLKEMNNKAKSISVLSLVSRDFVFFFAFCSLFYFETDDQKSVLLKAILQIENVARGSKDFVSGFKAMEMRGHKQFLRRWSVSEQPFWREEIREY